MSSASKPCSSERSFPLNVAIGFDMEGGLEPVMFSFVIETPPNQLKMLAELAEVIEQARYGKCNQSDRHSMQQALQKAKSIASNSAFNAALKRHTNTGPPMAQLSATFGPRQPEHEKQSRPSFAKRRRRLFGRQSTPMPDTAHLQSKTDGALELIREEEEAEQADAFSCGDLPALSSAMGSNLSSPQSASRGRPRRVDDAEDAEDELSDDSDLLSDEDAPEPQSVEQPQASRGQEHRSAQEAAEEVEEYVEPSRSTWLPASSYFGLELPTDFSVDELWNDDARADAGSGSASSSCNGDDTDVTTCTPHSNASDLPMSPYSEAADLSEAGQAPEHSASSRSPSSEVSLEAVLCDISSEVTPSAPAAPRTKSSVIRSAMRTHRASDIKHC
eukprot:TRINITY_DN21055_c0_g2_i1.p1 TRINITY_DN21055_c0_g2~~TRINITY_DN21055_c0_g2_i1.p1  ORF type:complete len:388 (+),score=63.06 TRINITY_DN21055_c0_g2_i1:118-1281(+)